MKKAKKYSNLRTNLQLLAHQDHLTFANNEDDKILFKSAQNYDLSLPAKEEMLIMDKILSQLKNETPEFCSSFFQIILLNQFSTSFVLASI